MVLQRLASAPVIRGNVAAKKALEVAVSVIASAGLALQQRCVQRVLFEGCSGDSSSSAQAHRTTHVVHCLGWQWNETSQHIQSLIRTSALPGEKASHGEYSTQVMVQNGRPWPFWLKRFLSLFKRLPPPPSISVGRDPG